MPHPDLRALTPCPPAEKEGEVRLFSVMQDESLRLPAFLAHYRKLGVQRFMIVDNASHDDTRAYLLMQPDVHLFAADGSFADARYGMTWLNRLLDDFGAGHWCVTVDCDELLVYAGCETVSLPAFCARLEQKGAQAMAAILLDMYSDKPMAQIHYQAGQDLIVACPYFDRDYRFVPRIAPPWAPAPFPPREPIGGPRSRLFFPEQHMAALPRRLLRKMAYRLSKPLARRGWLPRHRLPHPAPQIFKIPLVRWRPGCAYLTNHRIRPVRLAEASGALLHFKFLDDFARRVAASVAHGQHFGGSVEYRRYARLLKDRPDMTFMYPGSQRYRSSADLVQAGLMRPLV